MRKRKNEKRNWIASALAVVIALSWAVGGLIMPSLASTGTQGTAGTTTVHSYPVSVGDVPYNLGYGQPIAGRYVAHSGTLDSWGAQDTVEVGGTTFVKIARQDVHYHIGGRPAPAGTTDLWVQVPVGTCDASGRSALEAEADAEAETEADALGSRSALGEATEAAGALESQPEVGKPEPKQSDTGSQASVEQEADVQTPLVDPAMIPAVETGEAQSQALEALAVPAGVTEASSQELAQESTQDEALETQDQPGSGVGEAGNEAGTEVPEETLEQPALGEDADLGQNLQAIDEEPAQRSALAASSSGCAAVVESMLRSGSYPRGLLSIAAANASLVPSAVAKGDILKWEIQYNDALAWAPLSDPKSPNTGIRYHRQVTVNGGTVQGFCLEYLSDWGTYGGTAQIGVSPGLDTGLNQDSMDKASILAQMYNWTEADWLKNVGVAPKDLIWKQQGMGSGTNTTKVRQIFAVAFTATSAIGKAVPNDASIRASAEKLQRYLGEVQGKVKSTRQLLEGLKLVSTVEGGTTYVQLQGYDEIIAAGGKLKSLTVSMPAGSSWTGSGGATGSGNIPYQELINGKRVAISIPAADCEKAVSTDITFTAEAEVYGLLISGGSVPQPTVITDLTPISVSGTLTIVSTGSCLKTLAYDASDKDKNLDATQTMVDVVDEISYTNLIVGKTYTITGELHYQNVDANGTITDGGVVPGVTAIPVTFTVDGVKVPVSGTIKMTFKVPAKALAGKKLVAFEYLSEGGKPVASHTDITDKAQTVYVPELQTSAVGAQNSKLLSIGEQAVIVDTITWTALAPGDYVMVGKVMDKADATGKTQASGVSPQAMTFTITEEQAKKGSGTVVMSFTVPKETVTKNKTFVVFETAYKAADVIGATDKGSTVFTVAGGAVPVAKHEDINSIDQTVTTGDLFTSATDKADGDKNVPLVGMVTIVDTVSFINLQVGKEYTITGDLNYQRDGILADGKTVVKRGDKVRDEAGNIITATKTFTATVATGSETVEFTLPASRIAGIPVVVFEDLTQDNIPVASHADLNDEAQTIYSPDIETSAENLTGGKALEAGKDATVIDTVTWRNLAPGTYTLQGVLMDKKTKQPVAGATATPVTFKVAKDPKTGIVPREGNEKVTFKVPGNVVVPGASFVVFEALTGTVDMVDATGAVVGNHTVMVVLHDDFDDGKQTVFVEEEEVKPVFGGFEVTKILKPGKDSTIADATKSMEFKFDYQCYVPDATMTSGWAKSDKAGTLMIAAGKTAKVQGIPEGQRCEIWEDMNWVNTLSSQSATLTWTEVKLDASGNPVSTDLFAGQDGRLSFMIEAGTNVSGRVLNATNTITDNPWITTKARTDAGTTIGGGQVFDDLVSYGNLKANTDYVLVTELRYMGSGDKLSEDLMPVAVHTVTSNAAGKGSWRVPITMPLITGVDSLKLVVFEYLYPAGTVDAEGNVTPGTKVIAAHEERNPDASTSKQNVEFRQGFGSFDVIKKVVNQTGKTIEGPFTFTYECSIPDGAAVGSGVTVKDGKVSGTFNLKANETSPKVKGLPLGSKCTVIEKLSTLSLITQKVVWALEVAGSPGGWSSGHETDRAHFTVADLTHVSVLATNTFTTDTPELQTTALDKADGDKVLEGAEQVIRDTVTYKNIPAGDYLLIGKLWNRTDGHIVKENANSDKDLIIRASVKAQTTFGQWIMDIAVPEYVQGKELVVFEYLYTVSSTGEENLVVKHDDKESVEQSVNTEKVYEGEIYTNALEGNDKVLSANSGGIVRDTISYINLPANTEYELRGSLVLKGSGNAWTDTGIKAVKRVKTAVGVPGVKVSSGQWTLDFTVPAHLSRNWAGRQLVVFERLFALDGLEGSAYKEHINPNDIAQTIVIDSPPSTTTTVTTPGTPGTVTTTVTTTSTPPVASVSTTPPSPPVLGVVTHPAPQVPSITIPKKPPLARTGADDSLMLGAASALALGLALGLGILASKRRLRTRNTIS
ncbi:MAG: VaFE repeat-containing surface-anchored protein [Actinomycetaceae bacterium]|nr:VaFE repeat-containing surface-anchored protein [Actinomycetaceae bacterium]